MVLQHWPPKTLKKQWFLYEYTNSRLQSGLSLTKNVRTPNSVWGKMSYTNKGVHSESVLGIPHRAFMWGNKSRICLAKTLQKTTDLHVFLKGENDKGVKCAQRPYDTGQSAVRVRPMGIGPCTGHCCGRTQASGASVGCKG